MDEEVTVLFADLEGFTAMAEQLPAQEVVTLLNAHFTVMTDVVDAHGGHVDKFIGDAMLVVWGGEDPAEAARSGVRAALAMQRAAADLQAEWLREGRRPSKVRIGMASGRAVRGAVGAPQRREITVIGDAVNTASRLEALNKEFHTDIIVAESTRVLAGPQAQVRDLGLMPLKGRREPIRVYALVGWTEAP